MYVLFLNSNGDETEEILTWTDQILRKVEYWDYSNVEKFLFIKYCFYDRSSDALVKKPASDTRGDFGIAA